MAFLWTQKQDIGPRARFAHAMVFDESRNRTFLFGGSNGTVAFADTWAWDGVVWTQVQDIGPSARSGHTMAFDSTRARTVLFGGAAADGTPFDDTWEWDGTEWTQVADTGPSARSGVSSAFHAATDSLCLFGGSGVGGTLDDTWAWNGTAWTQVADTGPAGRQCHAMAYDSDRQRTVIFGGEAAGGTPLDDTWEWDGMSWTQMQDVGPPAGVGGALADSPNGLLLFGGLSALTGTGVVARNSTWEWNGTTWTEVQNMGPAARGLHAATTRLSTGTVVLIGGVDVGVDATDVAEHLYGDTWEVALGSGPVDPDGDPVELSVTATPNPVTATEPLTITFTISQARNVPTIVDVSVAELNGQIEIPAGQTSEVVQVLLSEIFVDVPVPPLVDIVGSVSGSVPVVVTVSVTT